MSRTIVSRTLKRITIYYIVELFLLFAFSAFKTSFIFCTDQHLYSSWYILFKAFVFLGCCTAYAVLVYRHILRNTTEERRTLLHRCGSLKSRTSYLVTFDYIWISAYLKLFVNIQPSTQTRKEARHNGQFETVLYLGSWDNKGHFNFVAACQ